MRASSERSVRVVGRVLASLILLIPAIGFSTVAKDSQLDKVDRQSDAVSLVSAMSAPVTSFTNETIHDLVVHFKLKNESSRHVDPELTKSELVIDGKPLKESALLFGSGPRDKRFSSLPPGDKLEFAYPLGHYIQEPGTHTLVWRSKGYRQSELTIKVAKESNPWKIIASAPWVQVATERRIYKVTGSQRFFVHVRIDNRSDKTLGFDCSNRFLVFYPNQWAESAIARRQVISEMRRNQNELTELERRNLIEIYRDTSQKTGAKLDIEKGGKKQIMVKLARQSSYDYYISFNSGDYEKPEAVKLAYMIVVMDGRMGFTDGKDVQVVRRDMNDSIMGEVPLATPVKVSAAAPQANILFDD